MIWFPPRFSPYLLWMSLISYCIYIIGFFFFLALPPGCWDLDSPSRDQIWTLSSESRVLTTGPPRNSLHYPFLYPCLISTGFKQASAILTLSKQGSLPHPPHQRFCSALTATLGWPPLPHHLSILQPILQASTLATPPVLLLLRPLMLLMCKSSGHLAVCALKVEVAQSCMTLCNPMAYTVHGILQARTLEWVASPSPRGSSQPRSPALQVDSSPAEPPEKPRNTGVGSRFFTDWAIREAHGKEGRKSLPY